MSNTSILTAFERMWKHITSALDNKSNIDHEHPGLTTGTVRYDEIQDMNSAEQDLARMNIGALAIHNIYKHGYSEIYCEWNGVTNDVDYFNITDPYSDNEYTYYKVSDAQHSLNTVRNYKYGYCKTSENKQYFLNNTSPHDNILTHTMYFGDFCTGLKCCGISVDKYMPNFIFVESPGQCTISTSDYIDTNRNYPKQDIMFAAPSAGVYVSCDYNGVYVTEFLLFLHNSSSIYLNEEDIDGRRFFISVDNNGVLKTVDRDSGVSTYMVSNDDILDIRMDIKTAENAISSKVTSPSSAEIGQILSVKNIDNNGNITWEAVDNVSNTVEVDSDLSKEGFAADAKVTGDAIANLNTLVGDEPVSDQISTAIAEAIVEVYAQDDEPVNAPEGSIWISTGEDGLPNTQKNDAANVYVADIATTDITTVDFSKYKIGDVVLVTSS